MSKSINKNQKLSSANDNKDKEKPEGTSLPVLLRKRLQIDNKKQTNSMERVGNNQELFKGSTEMLRIPSEEMPKSAKEILKEGGRFLCRWETFEELFCLLEENEVIVGLYFCHHTKQESSQVLADESQYHHWEEAASSGAWAESGFFALPTPRAKQLLGIS